MVDGLADTSCEGQPHMTDVGQPAWPASYMSYWRSTGEGMSTGPGQVKYAHKSYNIEY